MVRHTLILFLSLWVAACSAHDEQYYATHPKALQKAINKCPSESVKHLSCNKLEQIATRMNRYAFDLRISPQEFGKKIIALQETIAKQETELENSQDKRALEEAINQNKQRLNERLAIVGWLLAPEG